MPIEDIYAGYQATFGRPRRPPGAATLQGPGTPGPERRDNQTSAVIAPQLAPAFKFLSGKRFQTADYGNAARPSPITPPAAPPDPTPNS